MNCKYTIIQVCMTYFTFSIYNVSCNSMNDAKRLLADKKLGYEKNFRPVKNQSNPVEIFIGLELLSIREFDEVKEQLTITAYLTTSWIDEYMTWDPKEYGGLEELVIESDNVWTPNLVLINNVDKLEKIGDAWQVIRFYPNGLAFYYPGNVFPASCRVDVTYYPWDRHTCTFTFSPWAQLVHEITLTSTSDKVMTSYFSENGAWKLYDSNSNQIPNSTLINFSLNLERKPRFVMVNVILPIIFMTFLNTMIYAIPVESGERISYSITVLLALAVFLTLVGDNLPKTSSPMSYFGYYLLAVLVTSIGITLSTIFNVHMYYKNEEEPVPNCMASFVRCMRCKHRNKRSYKHKGMKETRYKTTDKNGEKGYRNGGRVSEEEIYCSNTSKSADIFYNGYKDNNGLRQVINRRVPYYTGSLTSRFEAESTMIEGQYKSTRSNSCAVSWKDVSLVFDKIFFIFFFLVIIIATIVFFTFISTSS